MSKEKINIYNSAESVNTVRKVKNESKNKIRNRIKKHKILAVIICIILIIALVMGGFIIRGKSRINKTGYAFIRTNVLAKGDLENSISATGIVQSDATSNVTTSLNYKIKSVNVSVGDSVKKGDVICTLDTTQLEEQIKREKENIRNSEKSA